MKVAGLVPGVLGATLSHGIFRRISMSVTIKCITFDGEINQKDHFDDRNYVFIFIKRFI